MGIVQKEAITKEKELTKIEKLLEETIMRTHIYERYFGYGFEGKDAHS